jgi:outer membrane murein-binding lipoprotein Lpp
MQSTINKAALNRLMYILTQEVSLCKKLFELTTSSPPILTSDNAEKITAFLGVLDTQATELKALSMTRTALMLEFARSLGISVVSSDGITHLKLRKLADMVSEPFSTSFRNFSSELNQLARQIQSAQSDNAYIIQRARDYVNVTLRLLASAQNSFGYSGELNQKSSVQLHTLA